MKVSPNDPRPAYLQIAAALREEIEAGRLKPGDRLPSGRDLAKQFGTALMTTQNALRVLRDEGLVSSQQGRGVFVGTLEPHKADAHTQSPQGSLASQLEAIRAELHRVNERLAAIEVRLGSETPHRTAD